MSLSVADESENNNTLSIPEILADFFLRKFDMPSYSDDSDHKYKSKKKKSKHKKRKHKKSKHRQGNDSSDSLSRSPNLNSKVVDDVSSSEEMGIQRLKKIKNMKLQSANKNALKTVSLPSHPEIKDKSELSNSSVNKNLEFYGPSLDVMLSGTEPSSSINKNLEFYGPSLDLMPSGVEPNSSSSKTDVVPNVSSVNDKNINFEYDLSKEEKFFKTNTDISKQNNSVMSSDSSIPLSSHNNENVHSVAVWDENNKVNDASKSDILLRNSCSEIQRNLVSEKLNFEQKCKSDKSNEDIKQNNSHPVTKHKSMDRERKHSRSRSRSRSHSRYNSSKSKHKRRTSRSSSRGSHHSHRKRKKQSRSHSRERMKSCENKRRSHSRSHSKSRYTKSKKNSLSPHERCRHRSRSRSRSRQHERSRRRSRSRRKRRSYSRDREHSSSVSRYKARSSRRSTSHSRSRSKSKTKQTSHSKQKSRSRSKSKEKRSSQSITKIDQAKILETARKNVLKMMQDGTLPEGLPVENLKKEQLISIQAGGKSVQELTDFCQRLSQKENEAEGSDNEDKDKPDEQTGFIHHPFKVKEPGMIKLNIKNAVQLPIKTHAQKVAETARLSSQFPVSSGNQHRQKELEWIPVVPATSKNETKPVKINVSSTSDSNKSLEVKPKVPVLPVPPPVPSTLVSASYLTSSSEAPKVEAPPVVSPLLPTPPLPPPPLPPPLQPSMQPPTLYQIPTQPVMPLYLMPSQEFHMNSYASKSTVMPLSTSIFKPPKKLDIPAIVAKRFQALTKLQQDPNDPDALKIIHDAQESIQEWVESQQVPGLFTGSTDAKMLTAAELCGPKYHKFRKDILSHAPPVTEGKGMSLLKKMGWNPGEGLGKNKEGSLEPLMLDIKTDKKGLVSEGENSKKGASSFSKELQGKHPVSALMELCSKRRWKPPLYTCVLDHGPPHRKLFCFKVEVNGVVYQPANPCSNKKVAKADAAVLCLQSLNILSKT